MAQDVTLYRILIASPSDLATERKIVSEVIAAWNAANSLSRSASLEAVTWQTHAVPEMGGRPQGILNRQLVDNCDVLVGLFWTRLGTPTGEEESGTVEEIREFIKMNKPVMLYFSNVPVVLDSIDKTQYAKLVEFREECKQKGLLFSFDSTAGLREQLQTHLSAKMNVILAQPEAEAPSSQQRQNHPEDPASRKVDQVSLVRAFKSDFEAFVRRLNTEWTLERDSEPYNPDEAKVILADAVPSLIAFRARITRADDPSITNILEEATKRIKAVQRSEMYLDGGRSWRAFWQEGDEIIALLEKVPGEIDKALRAAVPGQESPGAPVAEDAGDTSRIPE